MKTIYVLTIESNDAFLGCYATEQEARKAALAFRVPTRVFPWSVYFPMDFSKLDAAIKATQELL